MSLSRRARKPSLSPRFESASPVVAPLALQPLDAPEVPEDAHPAIIELLGYWRAIRPASGLLPGRQHLDPVNIPHLLPDLWLIDVVQKEGRLRFRYRLQGTRLVHMIGHSWRGRWFDDVNRDFAGSVTERSFERCVADGQPDWRRGRPNLKHSEHFAELERLFLPLARDGVNPDMLLAMTVFYDLDGMPIRQ